MDKPKKQAYLLIVLGVIALTVSFIIGVIFDNSGFQGGASSSQAFLGIAGYISNEQVILEILYVGLSFVGFILVLVGILIFMKNRETKPIIMKNTMEQYVGNKAK